MPDRTPTTRKPARGRGRLATGDGQGPAASRRPARDNRQPEGFEGWDDYAPFYDWENARTLGRRDVPFWKSVAQQAGGTVLELGCGTGRISVPLARAGVPLVGIDRSAPMLVRAHRRLSRSKLDRHARLVRGDIRTLPFAGRRRFAAVLAPYGILQSLLRERDLRQTLQDVHRVLASGGVFGMELVADLPSWAEYEKRVSLKGWRAGAGGAHVTLVETVRQDRKRRFTIFDQAFTERRGRTSRTHRFSLTFRTLSVPQICRRLETAGFEVSALLGDYRGGPWDPRADVWIVLARKP